MYDINMPNLNEMRPMENVGAPKWDITLCMLFAWIIVYLCILKGRYNQ